MKLTLPLQTDKQQVFKSVENYLHQLGLSVKSADDQRPWGGFFVIDEKDTEKFISIFFADIEKQTIHIFDKLSPKILLVEPGKRLSWQYHHRRAEIWKVVHGPVAVVVSNDDHEKTPETKNTNDVIILGKEQRHRLIGSSGWGIIAEIWQHTHPGQPSNEEDIIRLQDDFGR